MKKIAIKVPQQKPRNPFVVQAITAKAGKHQKTEKANRQQQKRALQKEMSKATGPIFRALSTNFIQPYTAFN
jgi:hypothetical protein